MAYRKHHLFNEEQQELAHFGFVMSHPARMQIIKELARYGVLTKSDLICALPLSAAAISDHLRYLERAQLIMLGQGQSGRTGYKLNKHRYLDFVQQLQLWLEDVPVRLSA